MRPYTAARRQPYAGMRTGRSPVFVGDYAIVSVYCGVPDLISTVVTFAWADFNGWPTAAFEAAYRPQAKAVSKTATQRSS